MSWLKCLIHIAFLLPTQPGEEYLSEDCQVKNTCGGANQFFAEAPVGCKGNEVCKNAMDGVGYCEPAQRTDINQLIDGEN